MVVVARLQPAFQNASLAWPAIVAWHRGARAQKQMAVAARAKKDDALGRGGATEGLSTTAGGLASSAWHIDQMGQPPRLGCLGMCTEQCAVADVNSKCWRNMFKLEVCLHTRQDRRGMRGKRWCRRRRRCTGERRRAPDGAGGRWRMSMRGGVAGPRP